MYCYVIFGESADKHTRKYRVKLKQGVAFRKWANSVLKGHIIKE